MSKRPVLLAAALVVLAIASFLVVPRAYQREHLIALVVVSGLVLRQMATAFQRATEVAAEVEVPAAAAVLREGPANFKRGWAMVGGVLKLTPATLMFSAHGFVQKATVHCWDLRHFEGVEPARTLGLVPNAIVVRIGGAQVKLVVMQRDLWMRDLRRAAEALRQTAA
jgi:hypothetical protein